jgi:hypothetical protein
VHGVFADTDNGRDSPGGHASVGQCLHKQPTVQRFQSLQIGAELVGDELVHDL